MRLLVASVACFGVACQGGPCGTFEAWNTALDASGDPTEGRYVRSCVRDSEGTWEDLRVRLVIEPQPVRSRNSWDWRVELVLPERALREGATVTRADGLSGTASRGDAAAGLNLTDGRLEILGVGRAQDPCIGTSELAVRVDYDLAFGAARDGDGPGAEAWGTDRFHLALGDWACE